MRLSGPPVLKISNARAFTDLFDASRLLHFLVKRCGDEPLLLVPMSAQLRAMLLDQRKDSKALVFRLSEFFHDSSLELFAIAAGNGVEQTSPPLFGFADPRFSVRKTHNDQTKIALRDALDLHVAWVDGKEISVADLIKFKCDKLGGAHYGSNRSELLAKIESLDRQGIVQIDRFVFGTGQVLSEILGGIVGGISSLSLHLTVKHLTAQQSELEPLACYFEQNTECGLGVFSDRNGRLVVIVKDLKGNIWRADFPEIVDFLEFSCFSINYFVNESFETEVIAKVNGHVFRKFSFGTLVPLPLFRNEFTLGLNYNWLEKKGGSRELCVGQFVASTSMAEDMESIKRIHDMRNVSPDSDYGLFTPNSYGLTNAGGGDMKIFGSVSPTNDRRRV